MFSASVYVSVSLSVSLSVSIYVCLYVSVTFASDRWLNHLSPNENICTIAQMKNIHDLFDIISTVYFRHLPWINLHIVKNAYSVLIAPCQGKSNHSNYWMLRTTIACYYWTLTSDVYFISCDPVSYNLMTIIFIDFIGRYILPIMLCRLAVLVSFLKKSRNWLQRTIGGHVLNVLYFCSNCLNVSIRSR